MMKIKYLVATILFLIRVFYCSSQVDKYESCDSLEVKEVRFNHKMDYHVDSLDSVEYNISIRSYKPENISIILNDEKLLKGELSFNQELCLYIENFSFLIFKSYSDLDNENKCEVIFRYINECKFLEFPLDFNNISIYKEPLVIETKPAKNGELEDNELEYQGLDLDYTKEYITIFYR